MKIADRGDCRGLGLTSKSRHRRRCLFMQSLEASRRALCTDFIIDALCAHDWTTTTTTTTDAAHTPFITCKADKREKKRWSKGEGASTGVEITSHHHHHHHPQCAFSALYGNFGQKNACLLVLLISTEQEWHCRWTHYRWPSQSLWSVTCVLVLNKKGIGDKSSVCLLVVA